MQTITRSWADMLIACNSQHLLLVCLQGPNNHNQIVYDCSLTTLLGTVSGMRQSLFAHICDAIKFE